MSACMLLVIEEHGDRGSANDEITDHGKRIRNLLQKQKTEQGGKDNLRVIEYGNFPRRCIGIRSGNGKLSAGSGETRQKQKSQLLQCHRMICENQVWQTEQTRKCREKEYDKRTAFAV